MKKIPTVLATFAILFACVSSGTAQTFSYDANSLANSSTGVNYYSTTSGTNAGGDPYTLTENNGNQFAIGEQTGGAASFVMQSGSLTVNNATWDFSLAQKDNASLDIQGGTLTINQVSGAYQDSDAFRFGNQFTATITQEGGILDLNESGLNKALSFGQNGGTSNYTMTGGLFETNDVNVQFGHGGTGAAGTGILTLTGGTFELTASDGLNFSGAIGSYINFTAGSTGVLGLFNSGTAGSTQSAFDTYVAANNILVGGATTTASAFTVTTIGNEDFYQIVSAPEPSTWAMMLAGLGVLFFFVRRRAQA